MRPKMGRLSLSRVHMAEGEGGVTHVALMTHFESSGGCGLQVPNGKAGWHATSLQSRADSKFQDGKSGSLSFKIGRSPCARVQHAIRGERKGEGRRT